MFNFVEFIYCQLKCLMRTRLSEVIITEQNWNKIFNDEINIEIAKLYFKAIVYKDPAVFIVEIERLLPNKNYFSRFVQELSMVYTDIHNLMALQYLNIVNCTNCKRKESAFEKRSTVYSINLSPQYQRILRKNKDKIQDIWTEYESPVVYNKNCLNCSAALNCKCEILSVSEIVAFKIQEIQENMQVKINKIIVNIV